MLNDQQAMLNDQQEEIRIDGVDVKKYDYECSYGQYKPAKEDSSL